MNKKKIKKNSKKYFQKPLKKQKKASTSIYFMIISLIIVSVIIIKLYSFSKNEKTYGDYMTEFYAKDLALLMETIQVVPGDLQIIYPLEDNFVVELKKGTITVYYDNGVDEKKINYRLFPQTSIKESKLKKYLIITKINNQITFNEKKESTLADCPEIKLFPRKELSIGFNREQKDGVLKDEDLGLIKNSFEYEANKNNLLKSMPKIIISLTSTKTNDNNNKIIVTRKKGSVNDEDFLQYFLCEIKKQISMSDKLNNLLLKEKIIDVMKENDDFEITIDFQITDEEKETLLQNRDELAKIIINSIKGLTPIKNNKNI